MSDDLNDIRGDLLRKLEELREVPADEEVDSGLRLIKAYLGIADRSLRSALVLVAERLATGRSQFKSDEH